MYLEGVGIRSIGRLEGVSNPLIIYWIRHFAQVMRAEIRRRPMPQSSKDIAIVEIDELFTYYKKKTKRAYVWVAIDRNRNKVIDFQVTKIGNLVHTCQWLLN